MYLLTIKNKIMEPALVSIVIPTHNRKDLLSNCITSLLQSNYVNFEIIVVNNASTDDTLEMLENKFPEVKIVNLGSNTLAAKARNAGLIVAKGEYVLFVDDDNIVAPDMMYELLKLMESETSIGMTGPLMYNGTDPERLWFAGGDINLLTCITKFKTSKDLKPSDFYQPYETGHFPNLFMISRSAVNRVGLFDENYGLMFEESDYAEMIHRAKLKIVLCPKARTWHHFPQENYQNWFWKTPTRSYLFIRNRAIYMRKHASRINLILFLILFYPITVAYFIIMSIFKRKFDSIGVCCQGFVDGYHFAITGQLSPVTKQYIPHKD